MSRHSTRSRCYTNPKTACTRLSGRLGALALAAGIATSLPTVSVAQADGWQREFRYYENEVNSECFIRILQPHYQALGYRLDGAAFITFGLESELGRKILHSNTSRPIDVKFKFDDDTSFSAAFTFDESQGTLYVEGQNAENLHGKLSDASSAKIKFKELRTGKLIAYDIPTAGIAEGAKSIAYCNPNISRFSLAEQKRVETLLRINTFRHVSNVLPLEQHEILDGLARGQSLSELVHANKITTPYDCLPEMRISCFHALKYPDHEDSKAIIPEWGEWHDAMKPGSVELNRFIEGHIQTAWNVGFPLLTPAEIRKTSYLVSRMANQRKCDLGYAADNSLLSAEQRQNACKIKTVDEAWLNARYCYDDHLKTWAGCNTQRNQQHSQAAQTSVSNRLNLQSTALLTANCVALDSAVIGTAVTGFGGRDKLNTFNISVEQDGSVLINGQRIKPKYWEHQANGSLQYTAISAADLSIALGGGLAAARMMPNVSDESANALAKALQGMAGIALGGRDRVFLIDPAQRTYMFGDVVNSQMNNIANARCR